MCDELDFRIRSDSGGAYYVYPKTLRLKRPKTRDEQIEQEKQALYIAESLPEALMLGLKHFYPELA